MKGKQARENSEEEDAGEREEGMKAKRNASKNGSWKMEVKKG